MSRFQVRDFELVDWQRDAVEAWRAGATHRYTGTLEIFTGGGKSLVALACAAEAASIEPELRIAIVVPTEALARQWIDVLVRHSNVERGEIGLLGAGRHDSLDDKRVLVTVLNSAARELPAMARARQPLMLIVDECHRAGAPTFSKVLATQGQFRLGLSATPAREELDEDGEPLDFDDQLVGRGLGPVVYRFGLRDARRIGWLPEYSVHHHGLHLNHRERQEYENISRRIDEAADALRDLGGDSSRAQQLQARNDDVGQAARAYVALTSRRKDVLYRATERGRVAALLVAQSMRETERRALLFHERVDDAVALFETLRTSLPDVGVRLEHSRLSDSERAQSLSDFRTGAASVLVSVKSLIEGIDVPDADVGISVASSSSVRQRIQSLGRVLRRQFDPEAPTKSAEMHVLYVADTVDEVIYEKEDWSDLTGEGSNRYWLWPADPDAGPDEQDGPPASPRPSEDAEWDRLGRIAPSRPEPWLGSYVGQEYSVDTMGNVTNRPGHMIGNPQGVADMVIAVRGRPGGRFHVTPQHGLVLVTLGDGEGTVFVAGQLEEPFVPLADLAEESSDPVEVRSLRPGDVYTGPATKVGGSYKVRMKRGGLIERRASDGGAEFALTGPPAPAELSRNAERLLDAWRAALGKGVTFHVNTLDHAWYTEGGVRRFLASVPGGFAWPSAKETP